ncbi:hypothetical protein B0H13DRAFT_645669 [Mycena leptocephala]|nr:hypothetical protein B0H13DRAFT_645669 [Mycena leptocephala]
MTRSRSCPLSIQIERGVNEVMAAVVSHCARFEHLKLSESSSDLVTIEIPMPLLRHLDLRMRNQIATVGTFRHVPLLRTVTLNHFAAVNVALPWAQLTSLTLNWVFPHEFFPILQQTLNLVHCELKVGGAHRDQSKPDTRLLRLESLTLNNFTGDVEGYLDAFLVPALLNLEISEPFLCANPIDSLALFISKSGCKLQKMHITDTKIITSGSYRQAFPSIQFFFDPQVEGESDSLDVASDSNSH